MFIAVIGVCARSAAVFDVAGLELNFARGDLWRVITYICVPSAAIGVGYPCAAVHPAEADAPGWAILPVGPGHILTVPTRRISGIENPHAAEPASGHYWQAAWDARTLVEQAVGRPLPRDAIGMAINSAYARTQDQFHIHTGCAQPAVQAALRGDRERIGTEWTTLSLPLFGATYQVRRIEAAQLAEVNVVGLLPERLRSNPTTMARQTLVVIGATFDDGRDGYYVLNTQASRRASGNGEALLDFSCRT